MVRNAQPPQSKPAQRPRRRRNSLDAGVIGAAARGVLEEGGIAAFTMRAVADRLGAAPMALYNHVGSKEELLDGVLDEVLAELQLRDDPTRNWAAVMTEYAQRHLALLRRHPWAVSALMSRPDPGPAATAIGEVYLATALRGGLDPGRAVIAFTGLLALVYGAAGFLTAPARGETQSREEVEAQIRGAAEAENPVTRQAADELADYGSDAQLAIAFRALLDGLAASS